ncbi:hypothetical protein P4S72_28430 [Vibrio sp. PP-XX7]
MQFHYYFLFFACFLPSLIVSLPDSYDFFFGVIMISQNLLSSFLLGALLSLFLFDQIDWHYRRSIRDELTGLHNRRYFNEQLQQCEANCENCKSYCEQAGVLLRIPS